MSFFEAHDFELGQTFGNSAAAVSGSPDSAAVGKESWFEDKDPSQGTSSRRSNRLKLVRAVRNVCVVGSGGELANGNLLPKKLVQFATGSFNSHVDGYAGATTAGRAGTQAWPVDEFLPSTGVVPNDIFYIVMKGPAIIKPALSALTANVVIGDRLVAITAATSGATTSGRFDAPNYNVATTVLALEITNYIGRALSALTTTQGTDLLVDVQA